MDKNKVEIIPKSITDAEKEIKRLLAQDGTIAVTYMKSRRWGMTRLQNLIMNTQDIEAEEQKQLPDSNTNI